MVEWGPPNALNRVHKINWVFSIFWHMRGEEEGVSMSSLLGKMSSLLGKIQMSSLLGKIQRSSLLEIFTGRGGEDFFLGPKIFFLRGRGGEKIFF